MDIEIKSSELKHLKTLKSAIIEPDPENENILITNSLRVLELEDEVIVKEITEIKIAK